MLDEDNLYIYTDGSSRGKPRTGGFAVRFVWIDKNGEEQFLDDYAPGFKGATNNQMEMTACIEGLKSASKIDIGHTCRKIVIRTDSRYIYENFSRARFDWPKKRWQGRGGRPILNVELWKKLVKAAHNTGMRVEIDWVKGHSSDEHNKAVDKMAQRSAKNPLNRSLSHVNVRRKLTDKSVAIGSVKMEGQEITIRVIANEYLKVHKLWRCKYEVMSEDSAYFGLVDVVFFDELLSPAHSYRVKFNSDTENPRIENVIQEIL